MKTPEFFEKKEICEYLDTEGAWYFKPYMAGFGKSGVGDILGCVLGRLFMIEVKRSGKEPTPIQKNRMEEVGSAGGATFAGTAETVIPKIKAWINGLRSA